MTATDDSVPKYPADDGPLTVEQLRAIAEAVRDRHSDATLLEQLFVDVASRFQPIQSKEGRAHGVCPSARKAREKAN